MGRLLSSPTNKPSIAMPHSPLCFPTILFITPVRLINGRLEAIADLMTTGRQLILADQLEYTPLPLEYAAQWECECGLCYL